MKKRIVILSAFVSPLRSGAEACAEEVPAALQDRYSFTIVTARMQSSLPRRDHINGIPVVYVGFGNSFDKWLYPFLAPFVVRKFQPDIIHAVLETFAGLALHFCRLVCPNTKRMLTLQTTNRRLLKRKIISSPHTVTAISSVLVNIAKKYRQDVVQISNGLHLQDIPEMEKIPGRIVFVGRLEKMKGIDVLLRACAKLQNTKYELRIVGEGSERKNLEALAKTLGITDRVTFVGFVPVPAVYKEFAAAQIFCGLSRSEALGNVFLEAQAAGCAVVGTKVGGIPDIIQNKQTGMLVVPDNYDAAAQVLEYLLTNDEARQQLAQRGKKHAQGFDWSKIADQYAEVYEKLSE